MNYCKSFSSQKHHCETQRQKTKQLNYKIPATDRALSISSHSNKENTTESTWGKRRLDNNDYSRSTREHSQGGSGVSGYNCEILPNQFNIPEWRFRQIKSERKLRFFSDTWGFPFADLLITWEKQGGGADE